MAGVSRRTFLGRGSMAVAAAGVLSSVPGLSGLLGAAETEAPAADASVAGADAGAADLSEPLVAHVRDLSTGEISLFNGTREVIVRNPQLASQLACACQPADAPSSPRQTRHRPLRATGVSHVIAP